MRVAAILAHRMGWCAALLLVAVAAATQSAVEVAVRTTMTARAPTAAQTPTPTFTPSPIPTLIPSPKPPPAFRTVDTFDDKAGDVAKAHIDITSVSIAVSGDTLRVTFNLRDLPPALTFNRPEVQPGSVEYEWTVRVVGA